MAIVMIYVAEIFRARFLQMFAFFVTALSEGGGPLDPMVLWRVWEKGLKEGDFCA